VDECKPLANGNGTYTAPPAYYYVPSESVGLSELP